VVDVGEAGRAHHTAVVTVVVLTMVVCTAPVTTWCRPLATTWCSGMRRVEDGRRGHEGRPARGGGYVLPGYPGLEDGSAVTGRERGTFGLFVPAEDPDRGAFRPVVNPGLAASASTGECDIGAA